VLEATSHIEGLERANCPTFAEVMRNWCSQPNNFGGKNLLTLSEQWYFVLNTATQSTNWQETLQFWGP